MKLALIGAGAMGSALLTGWLQAGWAAADLLVVEPHLPRAQEIEQQFSVVCGELADAAAADVVVLAVKPQQVVGVLEELRPQLKAGTLVVSIAAGVALRTLEAASPEGVVVFRVMPNTPALVGQAMSGIVAGSGATEEQTAVVQDLLAAVGQTLVVEESKLDALTALSGSGPAYLFYVAEAMIEAGVHQGLTRQQATLLVNQTFVGSANLLAHASQTATQLREMVTSPGGTTAAALRSLDDNAVRSAFLKAVEACARRSQEMGSSQ